jgi:branched-subunit amino acid aminotransferase/4-amino-4-deoxychorismate lyase
MPEPIAFLNGQFVANSALCVPVYDTGFVQGATVTEQLRTFGGKLFHAEAHFKRLRRSLEIVQIELSLTMDALREAAQRLVAENHKLIAGGDDLGLSIFVTPGSYAALAEGNSYGPLVAMHTFRLAFDRWAALYDRGCHLVTTPIQQVPAECWPAELKCRSRMHYYLADQAAYKQDPNARALLLDRHGHVMETSTANIVAFRREEGLLAPPQGSVLPGVSLMFLRELAGRQNIAYTERDLTVADLSSADEVLLSSTPNCLLPAVRIDGQAIGGGRPGQLFDALLRSWSEAVNVDIARQARQFARR